MPNVITRDIRRAVASERAQPGNVFLRQTMRRTGALSLADLAATTTNDAAAAGDIGELIESNVLAASAVALVTTVAKNVTSISLTAGDWDVHGNVGYVPEALTNITRYIQSISKTTDALDVATGNALSADVFIGGVVMGTSNLGYRRSIGPLRISLAATTPIYLVADAFFTVAGLSAFGYIGARRRR